MRVPTLEAQVQERGPTTYQPDLARPNTAIAEAVSGIGQAVVGLAGKADDYFIAQEKKQREAAEKAKKEATALTVAEASLKAEDGWSAVDLEHQKLKGTNASANRESAYKALDDVRKKTAEGIADPTARNEYLTRSAQRLADYHRRIDAHTLSEYDKARDETLKARIGQALGAAEADDPGKDKLAGQVEEEIKAAHPDAADPMVQQFRSDMAFKKVQAALARDNVEGASQYLQTQFGRESLGQHYSEAVEMVKKVKGIAEKTTAKLEAESLAAEVLKQATGPDGKLDEGKAKAGISEVPEASRIYARTIINERIAADAMQRKAELDGLKNEARKQLNHGKLFGSIDPKLLSTLESLPGGAEYVDKLRDDSERDARRNRVKAGVGNGAERKALEKEQARLNKLALDWFGNLSRAERAVTDIDEWATGRGLDESGRAQLGKMKASAKEYVDRGLDSDADKFTAFALNEAKRIGALKKGASAEDVAAFGLEAQEEYEKRLSGDGKGLSLREQREIVEELSVRHKHGILERLFEGKKDAYEFEDRAAARKDAKKNEAPAAKAATPPTGDPLVHVRVKKTGAVGNVPRSKFNPALYEELPQ